MSLINRLSKFFFKKEETHKNIQPEDLYVTTINEKSVSVYHPQKGIISIEWDKINEIVLLNTDDGPLQPDVWLVLKGENDYCLIPQGCDGFEKVYDIVSKYDGFNFENVINSMSYYENKQFLLWRR